MYAMRNIKFMRNALIIGGTNGIGLAIAINIAGTYDKVYILGRHKPTITLKENIIFEKFDLFKNDIDNLKKFLFVDLLIITAGIGRLAKFNTFTIYEISQIVNTNAVAIMQILSLFSEKLICKEKFFCGVVTSIAGIVNSPLYSVYSASKAALHKYIEAVNTELYMLNSDNVITNIAPGFIANTSFNGEVTHLEKLNFVAEEFIQAIFNKEKLYIPKYKEVYKNVIEKYYFFPDNFGIESYDYKLKSGRICNKPLTKVGYLSGTFDLFHIGHLNLLKRAKEYCDYLIVGVHKDASHKGKTTFISFEERKKIVAAIDVVDKVIESLPEDNMVWPLIHYDYLFVGSDYKGSERFNRYEEYFKDKSVRIIYFPYTQGTSSSKLREALGKLK